MNLLVSANDTYVMPLTVLLSSVFETNREDLTVWFMWADLSEKNRTFFSDYIRSHGAKACFLPLGDAFEGLPTKKYISRETYFRLLAASFLPSDTDRILWLDADMAVTGSLRPFYDTELSGAAVAACPHGAVMKPTMLENCERIGIRYPEQYFNAGVMLCNLRRWREMDIPEKIREILSVPREMKFPGQDLTNLLFNGEVKTEDWRIWNCMTHSILPDDLPALRKTAKIVHYAGAAKPWIFSDLPFSDVWMDFYSRSPFGKTPLRRTSYARMKSVFKKVYEN